MLLILPALFPFLSIAQEYPTSLKMTRELHFEQDSEKQTVLVEVQEAADVVEMQINARVEEGKLIVEVYDPQGKKQGGFSVGTQTTLSQNKNLMKRETAQGEYNKEIINPKAGMWKIVITPTYAKAMMSIVSTQLIAR